MASTDSQGLPNDAFIDPSIRSAIAPLWEVMHSQVSDTSAEIPARPGSPSDMPRDRGLWLLATKNVRDAAWRRMVQEYSPIHTHLAAAPRPFCDGLKRAADVIGAALLLVALAPLFMIIAALVRCDSPGPVFFRQSRVGRDGRRFVLWKFRTMHAAAPAYAKSPRNFRDPRITLLGRALRRTSLDELPQLFNVLRGEMSLVGPRPEMPFIAAHYTRAERQRLLVRPGMTGLWQISAGRGAPIHQNLHCDLHYIKHRNLVLDAAILLRTAKVVLSAFAKE